MPGRDEWEKQYPDAKEAALAWLNYEVPENELAFYQRTYANLSDAEVLYKAVEEGDPVGLRVHLRQRPSQSPSALEFGFLALACRKLAQAFTTYAVDRDEVMYERYLHLANGFQQLS